MKRQCCDVVVIATNRKTRRRLKRETGRAASEMLAHADDCPFAGRRNAPGWLAAGRARSPFRRDGGERDG